MVLRSAAVFLVALGFWFLCPGPAGAVRYLDRQFQAAKGKETCFDLDDLFRYQVDFGANGMQATLGNEADLVDFFVKLYGCPLLRDSRLAYSRHGADRHFFLVSVNNRSADGTFRTLPDLLEFQGSLPVYLSNTPILYPSLRAARASRQFQDLLRRYGQDQVFIEGLDAARGAYLGLFDASGRPVPQDHR